MEEIRDVHASHKRELVFFGFLESSAEAKELESDFGATLPRRRLRDRENPLDMRTDDFVKAHGMSKFAFRHLLDLTSGELDPLKACAYTT